MSLSNKDYQAMLDIVAEMAHAFPDRATTFLVLCERLDKLIGISSAVLLPITPATQAFEYPGPITYHCTLTQALTWIEHYADLDPLVMHWDGTVNGAVQNTDLVTTPALKNSAFYVDFLSTIPCLHIIGSYLGMQGDAVALAGFHRQRHDRPFSAHEMEFVRLLIPHFSQALHNVNLAQTISTECGQGVIMIGEDGQVSHINAEARRALNGRPASAIPALGLATNSVYFQSETGRYRVRVQSICGKLGKTIYLELLPVREGMQSKLAQFGLTKRQREIALSTAHGRSNREIAIDLHITEQTVKDHLRDVFEKMHIRRRSELIAKIFTIRA